MTPPSLTLASADWVLPIILVLVYAAQAIFSKKKPDDQKPQPPREREDRPPVGSLEELLEALGNKTNEAPPPPVVPAPAPPKVAPPVLQPKVFVPREPAPTVVRKSPPPVKIPEVVYVPISVEQAKPSKLEQTHSLEHSFVTEPTSAPSVNVFARMLHSHTSLRQAIVLNELLAPPMGLRDQLGEPNHFTFSRR